MPSKKHSTIWKAESHTIAKIDILQAYLKAWFSILGTTRKGQQILYIDGFAGPGEYTNHPTGSPVAALEAANSVLETHASSWVAGNIHCAFIDDDPKRIEYLRGKISATNLHSRIRTYFYGHNFTEGLDAVKSHVPEPFSLDHPLFVFIDPFGAKGVPFTSVQEILRSSCSEVLINLDADGIARIFNAGERAKHKATLTTVFGDESWETVLSIEQSFVVQCRQVLELYKQKLRSLQNVRYVFPFEMRGKSCLNYFLVFASQFQLGLQKMKEAMKRLDQTGDYQFSDADIGQGRLFKFDDPKDFSKKMFHWGKGRRLTYSQLMDYALNETPFLNPKKMLKYLETQGLIEKVEIQQGKPRKKGTFSKVIAVVFKQEVPNA